MKTLKRTLVIIGAAFLLAGCASTNNSGTGAMGSGSETGNFSSQPVPGPIPDPGPTHYASPHRIMNGSVSASNPLGLGGIGQ